ncbi:hypothetical protein [Tellurirhabdus bombi]|uniref:hypothetical protein n=1 Tax=Tellurirhabdus bombi TaxID=2907205 RepID=UPI001F2C9405|nr:hypothetical protein [Tellurirhabdus bombi]
MKNNLIVILFLTAWSFITYYLLRLDWWPTWTPQWICVIICVMAGLSLGATIAIFALSLTDRILNRLPTLFNVPRATSMTSIKNQFLSYFLHL